jgi:excisionase family DNA binding protein
MSDGIQWWRGRANVVPNDLLRNLPACTCRTHDGIHDSSCDVTTVIVRRQQQRMNAPRPAPTSRPVRQPIPEADLLTVAEVAAQLRVSKMTVYRLTEAGVLPSSRYRQTIRIKESDLETYLVRAQQGGAA